MLALIYVLTLTDFGVLILHALYEHVSCLLFLLKMVSLFVHPLMLIVKQSVSAGNMCDESKNIQSGTIFIGHSDFSIIH